MKQIIDSLTIVRYNLIIERDTIIEHEYDHLDGILATMRAIDDKSLILMQKKRDV